MKKFLVLLICVVMVNIALLHHAQAATTSCTVQPNDTNTQFINVRSGPGTNYKPLTTTRRNDLLTALATNADRSWVKITTPRTNVTGWVLAALVKCTAALTTLTVENVAPPQQSPAGPAPSPTPFRISYTPLPGGPGGDFEADTATQQGMTYKNEFGQDTFSQQMVLRVDVRKTERNRRVKRVGFEIFDLFGETRFYHEEQTAAYCSFGGGEPNCNILTLAPNAKWPKSDGNDVPITTICNGDYSATLSIFADDGDNERDTAWDISFSIDIPGASDCE